MAVRFIIFWYNQKGGTAMNVNVNIDWKFTAALGGAVTCVVLAYKANEEAAGKALIHAIDACKELAVACKCNS